MTIKRAPFNAEDGLAIVVLDHRQDRLCGVRDRDVLAELVVLDAAVQATVHDLIACDLIVHEPDYELALVAMSVTPAQRRTSGSPCKCSANVAPIMPCAT